MLRRNDGPNDRWQCNYDGGVISGVRLLLIDGNAIWQTAARRCSMPSDMNGLGLMQDQHRSGASSVRDLESPRTGGELRDEPAGAEGYRKHQMGGHADADLLGARLRTAPVTWQVFRANKLAGNLPEKNQECCRQEKLEPSLAAEAEHATTRRKRERVDVDLRRAVSRQETDVGPSRMPSWDRPRVCRRAVDLW